MPQISIDLSNPASIEKEIVFIERMIVKKTESRMLGMLEELVDVAFMAEAENPESIEIVDSDGGLEIRCTRESSLFIERQADFFFGGTSETETGKLPRALEELE